MDALAWLWLHAHLLSVLKHAEQTSLGSKLHWRTMLTRLLSKGFVIEWWSKRFDIIFVKFAWTILRNKNKYLSIISAYFSFIIAFVLKYSFHNLIKLNCIFKLFFKMITGLLYCTARLLLLLFFNYCRKLFQTFYFMVQCYSKNINGCSTTGQKIGLELFCFFK